MSNHRAPRWWKQTIGLIGAEISSEIRRAEMSITAGLLTLGAVLIFALGGVERNPEVASAMIWTVVILVSVASTQRLYHREGEPGRIRLFLSGAESPVPLYLSKMFAVFAVITGSGVLSTICARLFFGFPLQNSPAAHFSGLIFASLGLSALAALLGALTEKKSPDMFLAVLLMPLGFPIIIAGSKISAGLYENNGVIPDNTWTVWLPLLVFVDIVFILAGLWLYEPLLRK